MERKYTPGNWKVGKYGSTVVSDKIPENYIGGSGHDDIEYYGGFLIGESISNQDAKLIAAAPELLQSCINLLSELGVQAFSEPEGYSRIVQDALKAIKKATE